MFATSEDHSNWNPRFFEQGGLFDVFKPWRRLFLHHVSAFPALEELSRIARCDAVSNVYSGGGFPVSFVRQQRIMRNRRAELGWRANYQLRIFLSGEVPTRPDNWHDFFNAWTWIYLPRLKAAINARHFHCMDENSEFPWRMSGGNRNREQDMLTVFDEGGLVVVTDDDDIWKMISHRQWRELFLENGPNLHQRACFIPVGHALFECALIGHPRLHASCIRVRSNIKRFSFANETATRRSLAAIDELAALEIARRELLMTPDDLHALPIWGIPGWHSRAGEEKFIADTAYFR
ncbi:MAG: hypothetical protein RI953_1008 [Pseudomonadota bacterium]|jgi:hypothetical protein